MTALDRQERVIRGRLDHPTRPCPDTEQLLRRRALDERANATFLELQVDRVKRDDADRFRGVTRYITVLDLFDGAGRDRAFHEISESANATVSEGDAQPRAPALPAAVRTYDRGDPRREFEMRPMHERLDARHGERLEHGVRCRHAALDDLEVLVFAHSSTIFSRFAAAASCASRFDAPAPRATRPSTSTSTTKSRRCSGPVASSTRYVGSGSFSPCAHSCSSVFAVFTVAAEIASSELLIVSSTSAFARSKPASM